MLCIKRSLLVLLLVVCIGPILPAENQVARSILVLVDHSYSMQLPDPATGLPRLSAARGVLNQLLAGGKKEDEWALFAFDDADSSRLVQPFTRETNLIRSALMSLEPWGTTGLSTALEQATKYLLSEAVGESRLILLVSDCITTEGGLLSLPDLSVLVEGDITLYVLGFTIPDNRALRQDFQAWTELAGGAFFTTGEIGDLGEALFREVPGQARRIVVREEKGTEQGFMAQIRRGVIVTVSWIFLIAFGLSLGYVLYRALRWFLASRRNSRFKAPDPVYTLQLQVQLADGRKGYQNFDYLPVTFGSEKSSDIYLPTPHTRKKIRMSIERRSDEAHFTCREAIIINGVSRRERRLKKGDTIRFAGYRIVFESLNKYIAPAPKRPSLRFVWYTPVVAVLLVLFLVFRQEPVRGITPGGVRPEAVEQGRPGSEAHKQDSRDQDGDDKETETRKMAPTAPKAAPAAARLPDLHYSDPRPLSPGETPEYFKADLLFIHAHPDDESIDFGALMARASRSGKRSAVVLFTDGESGLDRYPYRGNPEGYPAYHLSGAPLARIRIQEARRALSLLGAESYIRLGLKNHPYNSADDVLSLGQLLNVWGGEELLVDRLVDLIRGFRPEIVISPDEHTDTREHFEHEGVGYLVQKALQRLETMGDGFVRAHLVSVDPLQKHTYNELLEIEAMARDQASGVSFRAIQAEALKAHITQRDAAVIALERIPNFGQEYYREVFWNLGQPLEDYLVTP